MCLGGVNAAPFHGDLLSKVPVHADVAESSPLGCELPCSWLIKETKRIAPVKSVLPPPVLLLVPNLLPSLGAASVVRVATTLLLSMDPLARCHAVHTRSMCINFPVNVLSAQLNRAGLPDCRV